MPMINDQTRKWWILGAMAGVLGLVVLDETVVGVALATIRRDLAMSDLASHWVVNAYLLTFTCFVAIGGKLGDSLGHRGLFVLGATIFAVASLAAGFATSGTWLIAARGLQGLGAAITFPASLAIMTSSFPAKQRGLAFGIQTTIAACFMSSGPLVGGFFTEVISWRWLFWINLPITAVIVLVALAALPTSQDGGKEAKATTPALDYKGLITLVAGLSALVIALMQGEDWGWGDPVTPALFALSILLLAIFAVTQLRSPHPLIALSLLGIKTFTGGTLVFFMFQFEKIAVFVFIPLYLQEVMKETPIDAGIVVVLAVLPTLITSYLAGKAADRFGSRRPLAIGLLLNGTALILVGLATTMNSYGMIVAPLVVWGATLPFIAVCSRRALMGAVPKAQQGQAGGVNLTIQMLGGTFGMALCGTFLLATGDYRSLFVMTGVLILAILLVAWMTIERGTEAPGPVQ